MPTATAAAAKSLIVNTGGTYVAINHDFIDNVQLAQQIWISESTLNASLSLGARSELDNWVRSGMALYLADGTRVNLIGTDPNSYSNIQVASGPARGYTAWIQSNLIDEP